MDDDAQSGVCFTAKVLRFTGKVFISTPEDTGPAHTVRGWKLDAGLGKR